MLRPTFFVQNQGQAQADVAWQAIGTGFKASFGRDGFALRLDESAPKAIRDSPNQGTTAGGLANRAARPVPIVEQRVLFVGANARVVIEPLDPQPGKVSFFHGRDPKNWASGLTTYGRLRYTNLYPGIDLVFYARDGSLEYDFVVAPGADPGSIRLRVEDGLPAHITPQGGLQVGSGMQTVLHRPLLYQNLDQGKQIIEGKFASQAGDTHWFPGWFLRCGSLHQAVLPNQPSRSENQHFHGSLRRRSP